MDSVDALVEEKKLMTEPKYRTYMSNIDKALRNFEYSSEWADLISALGKLSKAISNNTHYQVIPRRIKISKRLAQCMHPALPSGVHLKALETYAVIFSKTGPERLATELFIYSAGLFPLLGYAAMNVRPALLGIYETYFVPLGDKLRPALSGFLSGVFPGYECGLDHFERTNALLTQVCHAVSPKHFYTVLWECVATNAVIRLPAITYLLEHINKRIGMEEQLYIMGHNIENMISALCACLNDSLILVQRNTLEFLLIGFPMHTPYLNEENLVSLVTNSLNTILRRDMSLNRRLYSWLLGSEIVKSSLSTENIYFDSTNLETESYFVKHSKNILIKAIVCTLKLSLDISPVDLRPYRIMISLLDKAEIGSAILDFVLCDIIRAMTLSSNNLEVVKSANLLFASFEPAYIWCFITSIFEKTCKTQNTEKNTFQNVEQYLFHTGSEIKFPCRVGSGDPNILELCYLTEFLLETISLEMYNETTRVYLPKVLLAITKMLTIYIERITIEEVMGSLKLCMRIVSRVQPMITSPIRQMTTCNKIDKKNATSKQYESLIQPITAHILEKSKSDSKLNQFANETQDESICSNFNKSIMKNDQKKKKSKSYSKLFELDKEIGSNDDCEIFVESNLSSDIDNQRMIKKVKLKGKSQLRTTPKKSKLKNKSATQSEEINNIIGSNPDIKENQDIAFSQIDGEIFAVSDYSILEKCIRQYEAFFEIFLTREVFEEFRRLDLKEKTNKSCDNSKSKSIIDCTENIFTDETVYESVSLRECEKIDTLFETLKINVECRSKKLESLLCLTIGDQTNEIKYDSKEPILKMHDYNQATRSSLQALIDLRLNKFVKFALKLASNLLVEMSTFPNCNKNIVLDKDESIPNWLKALSLIGCYVKNDIELQLSAITTLFDLISLLKSQIEHTTSPGVSFVVMLPLLKSCHVNYLEQKTRTFQILTSNLWSYLGESGVDSDQITLLLYQLHNCLESGLVEKVIAKRFNEQHLNCLPAPCALSHLEDQKVAFTNFQKEQLANAHLTCMFPTLDWTHNSNLRLPARVESRNLKKFEIVWYLGRDKQSQKSFEQTLLKVLEKLCLPYYMPDRTFVSTWVQTSLLRGDLSRLLKPIYKILLCSNSKRVGIIHLHHSLKMGDESFSVIDDNDDMSEGIDAAYEHDICAISSEYGNIKYHIDTYGNKKNSPIRSFQKKVFGVALSNKNKTSNFVSSGTHTLNHSVEIAGDCTKIGLIVNPLQNSPDFIYDKCNEATDNKPFSSKLDANATVDQSDDSESSNLESDSENKDISTETEPSLISGLSSTNNIKRFVGDCEVVTELLSQHERTKNRKTYHLIREKYQDEKCDALHKLTPIEKNDTENLVLNTHDNDGNEPGVIDEKLSIDVQMILKPKLDKPLSNQVEKKIRSKKSKSPEITNKKSTHIVESGGSSLVSNPSIDKVNISVENTDDGNLHNSEKNEFASTRSLTINVEDKRRNLSLETSKCISEWDLSDEILEKSKENVQILRQGVTRNPACSKRSSTKSSNSGLGINYNLQSDTVYYFNNQMLVYLTMYDTKQVLYAFQTLRNIIACDSRTFLCLSITTSLNSGSLKQLLNRHRRSIAGKGFDGNISNTDYTQNYRGCMHLEVVITLCMYYARSYFYKESNENSTKTPTEDDVIGNCRVQLESFELLTFICNELIDIVKGMGKGLACYIADLMIRCKLQKIILNCLKSSVHSFGKTSCENTLPEQIILFNCPKDELLFAESFQIQILKCLTAIIKLEYEVSLLKNENVSISGSSSSKEISNNFYPLPLCASDFETNNLNYEVNKIISQQPLFLSSILSALKKDTLRHVHRNWTDMITSCLNCFTSGSLKNVVISVVYQLCNNVDVINKQTIYDQTSFFTDYVISQLEAVTILCHYCLLDNTQQTTLSHLFNQVYPQTNIVSNNSNTGQLLNNIVNSFLPSSSASTQCDTNPVRNPELQIARSSMLRHLPRIMATIAAIYESKLGVIRHVKQQLMEFLSPVSLHHGAYFLASISVTWQERGDLHRVRSIAENRIMPLNIQDQFLKNSTIQMCPEQHNLVNLLSTIRVIPMDSLVHTLHQVIKGPPSVHKQNELQNIELSCLELFYFYMKSAPAPQIGDSWSALLALLRDGTALPPPSQFVLLMILNDFVQRSPQIPFQDKKDIRDLHDVTSRLVESLSNVAGACLEQTTWLRRNLAVKEDISLSNIDGSLRDNTNSIGIQQFSLQAQSVLASVVANLLDVTYGSQEKEKVIAIVTTLLYNITPYLKNHTTRNIPSFYACSNLLASLSGYQYTRKSWRKEILDLLLDAAFFQMDISCLPFWRQIMDSLMTYDNTTFRELMNRVSLTQTGSLNIFTSREQEYEQRSMLLKRLAFVIFCSEFDQYNKYMPEIQEQLVNSLRLLSMVPSVQAAVFLCFRVLLLRMSADNVTSLWPIIIAEMVQVFLAMEQELRCESEDFGQQSRLSTGTDLCSSTSSNIPSNSHAIHWRAIQLEACKLLEMGCILPATKLPHFQMYRWAFVGTEFDSPEDLNENSQEVGGITTNKHYVPHVRRIFRLMEKLYAAELLNSSQQQNNRLLLTCQHISYLQELYYFFNSLCKNCSIPKNFNTDKEVADCLVEIERTLSHDFLEKMPTSTTPK